MVLWDRLVPKTARSARIALVVLAMLAAALALHGVWVDSRSHARPLSEKLLTVNEGVTIIIAVIALLIAHRQFVYAARPYLHWTTVESDLANRIWRAMLKNAGTGLAVIRSADYAVRFKGQEKTCIGSYDDIIAELRRHEVPLGREFKLVGFDDGSTLAGGDEILALEASFEQLTRLTTLDIQLRYEGVLGDSFDMRVRLIPARGLE